MSKIYAPATAGYTHPGKPEHIMRIYRRTCLAAKKNYGSSRALIHGISYVQEYLAAKRVVLSLCRAGESW